MYEVIRDRGGRNRRNRIRTMRGSACRTFKNSECLCGDEMLEAEGVRLAIRKSLAEKVIVCRTKGDRQ